MFAALPLEVIGLESGLREPVDPERELETGTTFAENAMLKARYYHSLRNASSGDINLTIADDSGLEVDALGGRPGIASARYAGPRASDLDRIEKLLGELQGVPEDRRRARFVCSIAAVWNNGERVFEGIVDGRLLTTPRGTDGFGYDPLFLYEPFGKTFAEMTALEKAEISHRGRALRGLIAWLEESHLLDSRVAGARIESPTGKSFGFLQER
jgi:XTP/dITP diphosphohydrolase